MIVNPTTQTAPATTLAAAQHALPTQNTAPATTLAAAQHALPTQNTAPATTLAATQHTKQNVLPTQKPSAQKNANVNAHAAPANAHNAHKPHNQRRVI